MIEQQGFIEHRSSIFLVAEKKNLRHHYNCHVLFTHTHTHIDNDDSTFNESSFDQKKL